MRRLGALLLATALTLGLAGRAQADSFLTSVSTGSKTAARVAGPAYTGSAYAPSEVKNIASKALTTIRTTKNLAIGLDVLQRVDSVAMDFPSVGRELRLGLAKLARTGDPKMKLLRGVNLLLSREVGLKSAASDRGISYVRAAAKQLPKDSAAQLLAGLSVAQREAFGLGRDWEKQTPLKREAAKYVNAAQQLEAKASHPRPLVREGLRQAKDYMPGYGGYKGLLK